MTSRMFRPLDAYYRAGRNRSDNCRVPITRFRRKCHLCRQPGEPVCPGSCCGCSVCRERGSGGERGGAGHHSRDRR